MRVSTHQKDHYWILSCSGNTCDLPPGPLFDVSRALVDGARDVILDLENLEYLSTIGVKCLEETVEEIRTYGGHLGVVGPCAHVRRQMKINGLCKDIPIYQDILEAVSKLDLIDYQPDSWQDQADMLLVWQKEIPIAGEIRKVIKDHPLSSRFRMSPVRDYEGAIEVLNDVVVSCVLVDSTFQIFKVLQFLDYLKDETRISTLPVIVVAGDDRMEEAQMMIRHGATELLRYPMNTTEAVVRIQNAISYFRDHTPYYPPGRIE